MFQEIDVSVECFFVTAVNLTPFTSMDIVEIHTNNNQGKFLHCWIPIKICENILELSLLIFVGTKLLVTLVKLRINF